MPAMPSITIHNVPDEVHQAIRVRTAMHGRSAEVEIRDILEQAATPEGRLKLGSLLVAIAQEISLWTKQTFRVLIERKPLSNTPNPGFWREETTSDQ
jgi:antitoxin FitA